MQPLPSGTPLDDDSQSRIASPSSSSEEGIQEVAELNCKINEDFAQLLASIRLPDEEKERLGLTLERPLPVAIRVSSDPATASLTTQCHSYFSGHACWWAVPWLQSCYTCQLHDFENRLSEEEKETLKIWNRTGLCRFQEAVSQLPVEVLLRAWTPQASCYVLDACAAPGGKTLQLLERLPPSACVIANDAESQRAHQILPQTLRKSKHPGVCITLGGAQRFPHLWVADDKATWHRELFDVALCDVPCSGDGTVRKNFGIRATYSAAYSRKLQRIQLNIVLRALSFLKIGGFLVYSTCSMSSDENAGVILEVLRILGNEAVRVDDRPRDWLLQGGLATSPVDHLPGAVQVFPHNADCGGFFVCLLQRGAGSMFPIEQPLSLQPIAKRNELHHYQLLDPASDRDWHSVKELYGLQQDALDDLRLLKEVSVKGTVRALAVASLTASLLLTNCVHGQQRGSGHRLLKAGIEIFRPMAPGFLPKLGCRWRPRPEAARFLQRHASRMVVRVKEASTMDFLIYKRQILPFAAILDLASVTVPLGVSGFVLLVGPLTVASGSCEIATIGLLTGRGLVASNRHLEL